MLLLTVHDFHLFFSSASPILIAAVSIPSKYAHNKCERYEEWEIRMEAEEKRKKKKTENNELPMW